MASLSDTHNTAPWPVQIPKSYPQSSPNEPTDSDSSPDSAFSLDASSSQSSVSSILDRWSNSAWSNGNDSPDFNIGASVSSNHEVVITSYNWRPGSRPQVPTVALDSRQHPRRTQRYSFRKEDDKIETQCPRAPPSLVRQSERKDNFVDSLVDTTTQMIETIWPTSATSACDLSSIAQQKLIGLRTFVQEVLKRSKTSYSTLQVALYYLILIQSCMTRDHFTKEQSQDLPGHRAMQCGRRMFLSALILASKYLQDRNYSARAWSKISGLGISEINLNELTFLTAVNWKLHIPEPVFTKWTHLVLKYSPSAQVNAPPRSHTKKKSGWTTIVPLLTPELDDPVNPSYGASEIHADSGYSSPGSDMSPPIPMREISAYSESKEPTPTKPYSTPRFQEPAPRGYKVNRTLPPLPRLGALLTPQLTPQMGSFCTPAASASRSCPKLSMNYAMSQVREANIRSTLDNPIEWRSKEDAPFPISAARHSLLASTMPSVCPMSSPESMISDTSSRSSRSSSISSIASSNSALPQPRLAVQAARRCAYLQSSGLKEENHATRPLGNECSLEAFACGSGHQKEDVEAATALHELALNHHQTTPVQAFRPRPSDGRKRGRPNSIDLTSVQDIVRQNLALVNEDNEIAFIPDDDNIEPSPAVEKARSMLRKDLLNKDYTRPSPLALVDTNKPSRPSSTKPALSRDGLPRKRTCAGSSRGGREEARALEKEVKVSQGMLGISGAEFGPGICY